MRHPLPFAVAILSTLFLFLALGVGVVQLFQVAWPGWVVIGLGPLAVVYGVVRYRRLAPEKQAYAYRCMSVIYWIEAGFIVGGIPGAVVGRYLAGDVGEAIGYFLTALLGAVYGGRSFWQKSAQPVADS